MQPKTPSTSEIPANTTSNYNLDSKTVYLVEVPILLAPCFASIVLNFRLALAGLLQRKCAKPTAFLCFFLALADGYNSLLLALGLILFSLVGVVLDYQPENKCVLLFVEATRLAGIPIPVGHLLLIAVSQLMGVLYPLHQETIITRRRLKAGIVWCWLVPNAFVFVWFSSINGQGFQSERCHTINFMEEITWRSAYAAFYGIPFLMLLAIYTCMTVVAMRKGKEILRNAVNLKAVKTTFIIVGSYTIGLLPATLFYILSAKNWPLHNDNKIDDRIILAISFTVNACIILKSLVNPFIYSMGQKEVQIAVKRLSRKLRTSLCCPVPLDEIEKTSLYALEHSSP